MQEAFSFWKTCRDTGWRRLIGSPKLQIIFHKRATKYGALLRKMTYKDKGSYESSPPCMYVHTPKHTHAQTRTHTHIRTRAYVLTRTCTCTQKREFEHPSKGQMIETGNTLQDTKTNAPHCNTLQHTATHCNTLHHAATHRNLVHGKIARVNKICRTWCITACANNLCAVTQDQVCPFFF